jgi:hypothetical protein
MMEWRIAGKAEILGGELPFCVFDRLKSPITSLAFEAHKKLEIHGVSQNIPCFRDQVGS